MPGTADMQRPAQRRAACKPAPVIVIFLLYIIQTQSVPNLTGRLAWRAINILRKETS